MLEKKRITCEGKVFALESKDKLSVANIKQISGESGISVYKLDFVFVSGVKSGNISISTTFPMKNILQLYSPISEYKRNRMVVQWFRPSIVKSNFSFGLPALSAVSEGNINYVTVGISDADNDCSVSFCVQDFRERDEVEFSVKLLCGREKKNEYSVFLRIDERQVPLCETLKEQTAWFSAFYPQPASYPSVCEEPLYSSWYNFHQHPSAVALCDELAIASKAGFKTVIIDDGWQYDGNGTSDYIDCGDWTFSKEKFPDPKGFTDAVHALGMKAALWFPVPYVGFNTKAYAKFKDKLLYEEGVIFDDGGAINAGILDVRYKEVRKHIVDVVKGLMEYGFDGMKLDFIDDFKITDSTPPANDLMDEKDLSAAIVKLLDELTESIRSVKSDAMIEFRQNYIGPNIVRFCNMLRVADCAFDSITNRIAIADLRMLNYNLAVHSDMLIWSKDETEENVARQLLNVVFSVPQISVLLKTLPENHFTILKNFISYWTENRKTLLHGNFTVEGEDCTYSALAAEDDYKNVVALYLKNDFTYSGKPTDILNASRSKKIYVDFGKFTPDVCVYDCKGLLVSQQKGGGVAVINIPIGGRAEIR